jgi:hypothetical protein
MGANVVCFHTLKGIFIRAMILPDGEYHYENDHEWKVLLVSSPITADAVILVKVRC